ncbi:hypothetical protein [Massilia sp. YMA4]|uniref:hypothetical protein n=1 Tax=Massilia sp. YMA4 TaxID=1593482 RepID=UPI0015825118|nr:hypothetical protein [Massilia sp. YMA4]
MLHKIGCAVGVLLSSLVVPAKAQAPGPTPDYEVPPLSNYVGEYRDKRRVVLEAIEAMPPDIDARMAEYDRRIGKLRDDFRVARLAEYKAVNPERIVEHSCTSESSGGVKNCGWKCTASPSPDHFAAPETVRVDGTNKGTRIDGGAACLKMTVAGKGRNAGVLHVNYRFQPAVVERRLNDETKRLFDIIGTRG